MTIAKLMHHRAAFTAQIEATPIDASIEDAFEHRREIEQAILERKAVTLGELRAQIAILALRAADGADVAEDLARLAAA